METLNLCLYLAISIVTLVGVIYTLRQSKHKIGKAFLAPIMAIIVGSILAFGLNGIAWLMIEQHIEWIVGVMFIFGIYIIHFVTHLMISLGKLIKHKISAYVYSIIIAIYYLYSGVYVWLIDSRMFDSEVVMAVVQSVACLLGVLCTYVHSEEKYAEFEIKVIKPHNKAQTKREYIKPEVKENKHPYTSLFGTSYSAEAEKYIEAFEDPIVAKAFLKCTEMLDKGLGNPLMARLLLQKEIDERKQNAQTVDDVAETFYLYIAIEMLQDIEGEMLKEMRENKKVDNIDWLDTRSPYEKEMEMRKQMMHEDLDYRIEQRIRKTNKEE